MKKLLLFPILISMIFLLSCNHQPYDEADILGLTSKEIVEKYGEFYRVSNAKLPDDDGLYRSCQGAYLVAPARRGYLGSTYPVYFTICFDEDGIAYKCYYEEVT